ncbi:MAG: hypothetical protein ACLR56_13155 [Oscillospiraceae bacterium]
MPITVSLFPLQSVAQKAVTGRKDKFIAYDMGPCGRLLEPLGDLPLKTRSRFLPPMLRRR